MERLVIIGSGMATARLLEELVANRYPGAITVIGDEPEPSYNRILLSPLLAGEASRDDLSLLSRDWYQRHRIQLLTGGAAVAVDLAARRVTVAGGDAVPFDKLVFATGSSPLVPDIPGSDGPRVMGFRTLADLERLEAELAPGDPVVVVGGGLLGLEAAHGLISRGMAVTLVHRQAWLMNRQLDREGGAMLREQLARRGIGFRLGTIPLAITAEDDAVTLSLDSGETLSASKVLFAAGIVPNAGLAAAAGIPCARGILVDEGMETVSPGVHALGECCQLGEITFGLVAPVVSQAAVLAARLCGDPSARYRHREVPTQLKVSGVELFSAGPVPEPGEGTDQQILRDPVRGIYRRLVFSGQRLRAAVLLGDGRNGAWYGELIDRGEDITPLRHNLVFGRDYCGAMTPGQ